MDAIVETRVHGRSGEVRAQVALDREAVELLGGNVDPGGTGVSPVDVGAQVDDLRRAGWVISPARRSKSGGATVDASKRFHHPGELGQVMAELSGPGGPLQGFRLERRRSLTRTHYRLTGRADLRAGRAVAGFGNVPDLADRLQAAGVDAQRVEELLTSRAATGFRLQVVADLPGSEPTARDVPPGERVDIHVSSTAPDRARPLLLGAAAAAAVAALVVLRAGRRR